MSENNLHWREDIEQLPTAFENAWNDTRALHLEADEWHRNYEDRHELTLSGELRDAWQSLIDAGMGDMARMLTGDALRGDNFTLEVAQAAKAFICNRLTVGVVPKGEGKIAYGARYVNQMIDGVLDANDFWDVVWPRVFDFSSWHPVGICKVMPDPITGEIITQAINPRRFHWHRNDGHDLHECFEEMYVNRHVAMEWFPDHKEWIRDMATAEIPLVPGIDDDARGAYTKGGSADLVCLIDCWSKRVGSGEKSGDGIKGKPGRHYVMGADTDSLAGASFRDLKGGNRLRPLNDGDEHETKWFGDWLPYASYRWLERAGRFGGMSIAEIVAPYHKRIDWIQSRVIQILEASVPRWIVHSKVKGFKGASATMLEQLTYEAPPGAPGPSLQVADMVPKELLERIETEKRNGYDKVRVNRDAARGEQPKGINSAPGQRAWDGNVLRALRPQNVQAERFVKHVARCIVGWAPIAYKDRGAMVRAPGTDMLMMLPSWTEQGLEEEKYDYTVTVSSGLSGSLANAFEETLDLEARNMLTRVGSARALVRRLPEVQRFVDEAGAYEDMADTVIARCLEEKPRPYTPLAIPEFIRDFLPKVRAKLVQVINARLVSPGRYSAANVEALRKLLRVTEWRAANLNVPGPVTPVGPVATEANTSFSGQVGANEMAAAAAPGPGMPVV